MAKLLAVLLIRSDQVVASQQLTAEIWGEHPPRRAAAALHVYISQLRKLLHCLGRSESPIITRAPGYLLRKGADEIDFHDFLQLAADGRAEAREGRYEKASGYFDEALRLWRGPLLDDLRGGTVIDSFVTRLTESRLECLERLADAQLSLGRHREIVGSLYALTTEYPFYEAFYRQLMLALCRSERRADALRVYQVARKMLHLELGLEPCRALRELQQAILAGGGETRPISRLSRWMDVESLTGLASHMSGPDQVFQELRRGQAGSPEGRVQFTLDRQGDIQPHDIQQAERPKGVSEARGHHRVDVGHAGITVLQHSHRVVEVGEKQRVDDESGAVGAIHRALAQR